MANIIGPPAGATRNRPITGELRRILNAAADATGVDTINITSGGQPGTHGRRTGSTRHDGGRAADLQLVRGGRTLTFTDQDGGEVASFVTAAAARGATGIGAGVGYMGNRTIHVGFGLTPQDQRKLVWGAQGASANAPAWLRTAARRGWDNPEDVDAAASAPQRPGRYVVIARGGLWLRKGPGREFEPPSKLLGERTELTVVGFDGPSGEWARVDLQDDGMVDGHVFAAFLAPAEDGGPNEEAEEEPGAGDAD